MAERAWAWQPYGGVVTDADGALTVSSEPGQGTTFAIYLPLVDDEAMVADGAPEPPTERRAPRQPASGRRSASRHTGRRAVPPPPSGRGSVLVVEDQTPLRELVLRLLNRAGYDAIGATDGTHALAVAAERRVDLLLTDVVMPGMSGPELADTLRRSRPELPVLFSSGFAQVGVGSGTDGADLLPKPFTRALLLERVEGALAGSPVAVDPPAQR